MWIIGVDGGGSKCKAVLYKFENDKHTKITQAIGGSANVFSDFSQAIASLTQVCQLVVNQANEIPGISLETSHCYASFACAGGAIELAQTNFAKWQHGFKDAWLITDIHASCLAANQTKDCILAITGTGSCVAKYSQNRIQQFGGHGFALGDEASGAWFGKKAISWYLKALEIPTHDTELFDLLVPELGKDTNTIIEQYSQGCAGDFAKLAPKILTVFNNSSHVQQWVEQGTHYLSDILRTTMHKAPMFIDGGLAYLYQPNLEKMLEQAISRPQQEACYGAFTYALQQLDQV